MPRKRTHGKRRVDAYSGAEAWSDYFEFGHSMFDDFSDETGVETDSNGRVAKSTAWAAWQAYGLTFLSLYGREKAVWALEQFGEPVHAD